MSRYIYIFFALVLGLAGTTAAETGTSFEHCRAIEADDARLRCYDEAARGSSNSAEPLAIESAVADPVSPEPAGPEPRSTGEISAAATSTPPAVTANSENEPSTPQPEASDEPSPEELFGLSNDSLQKVVSETTGVKVAREITSTIRRISSANRNDVFHLENGQTWMKTDGGIAAVRLKVGDEVVIRKAALGSYSLRKRGRSRSIKVRRLADD